jgi:hypothetical protein
LDLANNTTLMKNALEGNTAICRIIRSANNLKKTQKHTPNLLRQPETNQPFTLLPILRSYMSYLSYLSYLLH